MEPPSARRWRLRLAAPAVALGCAVLALLAGQLPASAAQPAGTPAGLTISAAITHRAVETARAGTRPDISVRCAPGVNEYNRLQMCWVNSITFTFLEDEAPVGTTVVTLYQYIVLRPKTKSWTEYDTVATVTPVGTTAPIEAALITTCGTDCVASGGLKGTLRAGLTGTVSYTANLPKNGEFTHASEYVLDYDAPPYIPVSAVTWSSPLTYRCDNGKAIANTTGCVFPKYTPTLLISVKVGGASAVMIAWAQVNNSAHWGWQGHGKPLTRQQDQTIIDANRGRVCDSTFHPIAGIGAPAPGTHHPWTDADSCDEFPFAATNQSGAATLKAQHKTGAACAQLEAVRTSSSPTADEAAQWGDVKVLGAVNAGAPCVRAHIPNRLNGAVGNMYNGLISSARLANGDPFWVGFVA